MKSASPQCLEALELLQKHLHEENNDPVPAGFLSSTDWAEQWKKSVRQTSFLLERALKLGLAERISLKRGHCWVRHYKFTNLLKKGKSK
jgi:hypothetical protein